MKIVSSRRQFGRDMTNQRMSVGHAKWQDKGTSGSKEPMKSTMKTKNEIRLTETEEIRTPVNFSQKKILIEWLSQVHLRFRLSTQTLYLAIGLMDRYVSLTPDIPIDQLQLVASTCLWLASKYEEIYPPHLKYFSQVTNNTFTKQQILQMEQQIVKKLDFKLGMLTRYQLLMAQIQKRRLQISRITHLAHYLLELSLLLPDHQMNQDAAKASLYLASRMLRDSTVFQQTGIDGKIKQIAFMLARLLGTSTIGSKYDKEGWGFVGGLVIDKK